MGGTWGLNLSQKLPTSSRLELGSPASVWTIAWILYRSQGASTHEDEVHRFFLNPRAYF